MRNGDLSFVSVALRLSIALLSGAALGYGRAKKQRAAGLRTYMLTSIGACLAMILAQYEYAMLTGAWAPIVEEVGLKVDVSRYGAYVITGIGFLASGTIVAARHQQVSGLTTASGLLAVACLGFMSGAGFWEGVIVVLIPLVLVLDHAYPLEYSFKRHMRNLTVFISYDSVEDISSIIALAQERGAQIFEIDPEDLEKEESAGASAVVSMKLSREHISHTEMLSSLAELPCVRTIQELIS